MLFNITMICAILIHFIRNSQAFYVNPLSETSIRLADIRAKRSPQDEWAMFKHKLGLTNEKVALLKSQENQNRIRELLYQYLEGTSKHSTASSSINETSQTANYNNNLLLRASIKFELADRDLKLRKGNRSHPKVAIKLSSIMPVKEILEILKVFNHHNSAIATTITMRKRPLKTAQATTRSRRNYMK